MALSDDLATLAETLNRIAALYQFRDLNRRLFGQLTVSQAYCVRLLFFRGAQTMTQLADELDVRLSTVTGVIDQLERRRLVERIDHPSDRRSWQVQLTTRGEKLYHAGYLNFLSHLEPLLASRPAVSRKEMLGFLSGVETAILAWRGAKYGKADPQR